MSSEFYFLKDFFAKKITQRHKGRGDHKERERKGGIFSIYALVDLCRIKYLVVQAGGMRGGKTFSGVLCRRDFAANLCFYPTACLAKARRQILPEFFQRADRLPVRRIKSLGINRIVRVEIIL
jgi:hypothetical protein